jgi:hypothetical protein
MTPNPIEQQEALHGSREWRVSSYAPRGDSDGIWTVELWGPQPSNNAILIPVTEAERRVEEAVTKRDQVWAADRRKDRATLAAARAWAEKNPQSTDLISGESAPDVYEEGHRDARNDLLALLDKERSERG